MKIVADKNAGGHKQGSLVGLKKTDIDRILGFKPNVDDDPYKVKYSWGFTAGGRNCGIWDWKGSWRDGEWSFYGPADTFRKIFGDDHVKVGAFA